MKRGENKKDIIDENVLLYLGMDLTDKSQYQRVIGTSGTVSIIEDEGILINGASSSSYIYFTMDGIGTDDFKIEYDYKFVSNVSDNWHILMSMGGSNSSFGVLSELTKGSGSAGWFASGNRIVNSKIYSLNQWHHDEFKRENGLFTLIRDDETIGTSTYNITGNWNRRYYFGANQSSTSEHFNGYVKNLIIRKLV